MLRAGFEQEVRGLLNQGVSLDCGSMRSLGYKEMAQFVDGQMGYSETVSAIKQSTRRYAKRQQTWFRLRIVRSNGSTYPRLIRRRSPVGF